jgi:hypothetical protein
VSYETCNPGQRALVLGREPYSTFRKGKEMEVETRSRGELIAKLQQVTLRGSSTQPYLNARIDVVTIDPSILAPTQRYVLTDELKKIEQVRWDLLKAHNQDIFRLEGYIKCFYLDESVKHDGPEKYGATIDVLPPVIEEHFNHKGGIDLLICDGQHRAYLAYTMGTLINVAYIRGVNTSFPYYAYALPNGWDDVEVRDDIPQNYIKKFHVAKDHKKLYRNFNSQFENIGDSRKRSLDKKVGEA